MTHYRLQERPGLWKMLEREAYATGLEYIAGLREKGYRVSDWVVDVVSKPGFAVNQGQWPLPLVRLPAGAFGFTQELQLSDLYQAAAAAGLENPPVEAALALRFRYDEQPAGEWLRVATSFQAMLDSDGVPHLPKLGKALGRYYLSTYWSYPHAVFYPHNEFVFVDRSLT